MHTDQLHNFDIAHFLEEYWQQKPQLIREALVNFESPLEANDLAGLALEASVESRIIVEHQKNGKSRWQLLQGPFSEMDYQNLADKNWTLLVQAVDFFVPEVAALKKLFRFIPDWRLDDVMVSFAPQGGSVGPHFDQYDVFLLQAQGQRIWKTGQLCDETTPLDHNDQLKIIKDFRTEQEHTLNAGDILYVPPGIAHWGISNSDDCMTISIGFRAPSHAQILQNSCDEVSSQLLDDQRFTDIILNNTPQHAAEIPQHIEQQLKNIIRDVLLTDQSVIESFGKMMTELKYDDDDIHALPSLSEVKAQGLSVRRALESRLAYYKRDRHLIIFANGLSFETSLEQEPFIQALSDNALNINRLDLNPEQSEIIDRLLEFGIFEIDDDDDSGF